jgi:hypothetical protein
MASLAALIELRKFLDAFKKQRATVEALAETKVKSSRNLSNGAVRVEGESRQEVPDDSTAQG